MDSNKLVSKFLVFYEKYKTNKIFISLLFFCSLFYSAAYKLRLALYSIGIFRTHKLPAHVISIGNITAGGTGKTPFTIESAKYFLSLGYKVAVLSRGYSGNNNSEVVLVSDGNDIVSDYDICGEEPILIAKKVPKAMVLVGKNRVKTGKSAINLGAEVLILDDGYQHLKLHRDENILMVDSYNPFDENRLIPLGKLRENISSIKRATGIVLTNSDKKAIGDNELSSIKKYAPRANFIKTSYRFSGFSGLNVKKSLDLKEIKGLKVFAFSGIGNPSSFIDLLKRNGVEVSSYLNFPDHHLYEYGDIQNILILAKKYQVEDIVTTEKDAIKIDELCQAAPATFWSSKLEVHWDTPNMFESLYSKIPIKKRVPS